MIKNVGIFKELKKKGPTGIQKAMFEKMVIILQEAEIKKKALAKLFNDER